MICNLTVIILNIYEIIIFEILSRKLVVCQYSRQLLIFCRFFLRINKSRWTQKQHLIIWISEYAVTEPKITTPVTKWHPTCINQHHNCEVNRINNNYVIETASNIYPISNSSSWKSYSKTRRLHVIMCVRTEKSAQRCSDQCISAFLTSTELVVSWSVSCVIEGQCRVFNIFYIAVTDR